MRLRAEAAVCLWAALALMFVGNARSDYTTPSAETSTQSTSSRCPAPGTIDAFWEPGDVVECSGPCITKIVPTNETVGPDEAGGFVSKIAMHDVCGEIMMEGVYDFPLSGCPVTITALLRMPPTAQEEQAFYFVPFVSQATDRVKLWVDNKLLVEQWTSLSSVDPISTGQNLDHETAPYKIVIEYNIPEWDYAQRLDWQATPDLFVGVGHGNMNHIDDFFDDPDPFAIIGEIHDYGEDFYDEDGWRMGFSELKEAPFALPTIGASRTPVKIETSCVGAPPMPNSLSPSPLPCPSPQHAGGTSLFVNRADGFSWQCCYGNECVAEFMALRDRDIYPSDQHCMSEQVRACTAPVIEAYKCQHGHNYSTFDFVDTGDACPCVSSPAPCR